MLIVKTKEALEKAVENKVPHFIVEGELAEKIQRSKQITTLSKWTLGILTTAIAGIVLAPTNGISGVVGLTAVSSIAALTGLEVAVIMAVAFIGITLVMAVYKDYDAEFETDLKSGKIRAKFSRKK